MRQNLRRRHPEADEAEIERGLAAWLRHRPGAEHGDAVGRPCPGGSTTPSDPPSRRPAPDTHQQAREALSRCNLPCRDVTFPEAKQPSLRQSKLP